MLRKTLSIQNLEKFDFKRTKRNIKDYFIHMENLECEWAKLNAQKGLITNYDKFKDEYRKHPYTTFDKDIFNLSAKELTLEELKKYISNYYWAVSILSDIEQLYIIECFINDKCDDELVDLLGFNNCKSRGFRKLKRSAVYKFADFLSILVEKVEKETERV